MTTWKPVENFPGYEVSSEGDVRSWLPERNNAPIPKHPRILKFAIVPGRYRRINMYAAGRRRSVNIPVLVAETFHGPRPHAMVLRHLNGKSTDDRAVNLKWGTPQENSDDARRHGTWLHGEPVHTSKLTEADVVNILQSSDRNIDLAKQYGVTPGNICHIRKGRSWNYVSNRKSLTQGID